ncbi:MAG TPA: hypothetical protein VGY30_05080 [Solirubrobacteraceae bacterium]|nr:hypothetical protein [Solirubrobacteraceae bacterium]
MRAIKPAVAFFAALAVWACCAAIPALATTVGGLSTSTTGPFALLGGRLFTPVFLTNNAGEGFPGPGPPPTEMTTELQSLAAGKHGERTLTLDASTTGSAPPAIAARDGRLATAWVGVHGLQTAFVTANGAALRSPLAVPASGAIGGYEVAIASTGARAVLWLDSLGVRLQSISSAGVPAAPVTLAAGASRYYSLNSDDAGGWWVLWIAGTRLLAADVAADGTTATPIDLGAAPVHAEGARVLHPRLWSVIADGKGGVWVVLTGVLLHVGVTGVSQRHTARMQIVAEGDRRTSLAEEIGAGGILVRPLGRAGRALRLRNLGSLLDLAYDDSRQRTELLTAVTRGSVELTTLSGSGHVSSVLVRGCPRAGTGELVAHAGLVGVACAGRPFEAESVETGGDFEGGRYVHYYLLHEGRRIGGEGLFEGLHAY